MKLVINEKHIKRNKNIGSIIFIINLLVLGTGGPTSPFPGGYDEGLLFLDGCHYWFYIDACQYVFMNRYARSPRLDEILAEEFGKLRHDYTFFSFSSPVPYLLLGPCRIWLPIIVNGGGEISFKNGKWRHTGVGIFQRITGQESVVIPELEVAEASKKRSRNNWQKKRNSIRRAASSRANYHSVYDQYHCRRPGRCPLRGSHNTNAKTLYPKTRPPGLHECDQPGRKR